MNILSAQIEALRIFGYSEAEARFLHLVATHSGYFVARQFCGFTSDSWGKRTTKIWKKLQSKQHARTHRLARGGTVYHLFSHKIYRQIGREFPSKRHEHELHYIHARIAMLDFVLANPDVDYFETEADKVAYFLKEMAVAAYHLPSKSYGRGNASKPTVRYFVDQFPMFLQARLEEPRLITFTYLQGAEVNLSGFVHHLQMYLPLFRELSEFRFLFLARSEAHFLKASELFRTHVAILLEPAPAEDLLRYFTIRKAWDLGEYDSLGEAELIFRNLAKERFAGARFEHYYRAWRAGRVSEAELQDEFRGSDKTHKTHFETLILKAFPQSDSTLGAKR